MSVEVAIYTLVLALINYPFVVGVEWYVRNRPVKPIFKVDEPAGRRAREMRNSWLTTPVHAVLFAAFIGSGALQTESESFGLALATFGLTFLWTELWHYISHIAMHAKSLHFIHREHRRSQLTAPWTSVSFSILEKFIFSFGILGGLAVVSRWHNLSAFGIFAYYVLYFYTNTRGHANFEFREPGYYRRFMGKIFTAPSYHALQHARYIKNYGLITPWLDRLFGTEWEDVPEVQTAAGSGVPLLRLGEKCMSTDDHRSSVAAS
jgi:sterol desaturase/sphingolipid hydroxylase (fatty acid hydroxylase superfamily)